MRPALGRTVGALRLAAALWAAPAAEAGDAAAPDPVWEPAQTADAVLVSEDESWPRQLHDWLQLPTWLDVAVEQRTRFEALDDPWRPGEEGSDVQLPQRTRLRVGLDLLEPVRFLAEFEDARTHFDGDNDFRANQTDEFDVLQLFASVGGGDLLGTGLRGDAHVGRLTLDVGSRRLVARNRFRNTTNSFDGLHLQLAGESGWRVRAFGTKPVERHENALNNDSTWDVWFWGAALESRQIPWLNGELYYVGLEDDTSPERHYQTFGGRGFRLPKAAQLDYELELMGQAGHRQAAGASSQDQAAFATYAGIGYTFARPWFPRLLAQFGYASGSDETGPGADSQTFDPLFAARRSNLMPTGIFGPFRRANICSPGLRLLVSPRPNVEAQIKWRYWELAQGKDAFSGNGLRDPSGEAGRDLGHDLEISLQWSPWPWLALDAGYDHWFKGSYLDQVPLTPTSADTDYVYLSLQLRL